MLSSLVPGYKSPGHPVKVNRREERRRGREERRARDDEYVEAVRRHESRNPVVRAGDEMVTADEVVRDPADWDPDRNDLAHVDTGPDFGRRHGESQWEAMERQAGIRPVHGNPTTDPANPDLAQVSRMAGYSDGPERGAHDAMAGVGAMALGWVDSNRELEVDSITEGGPLRLAPFESVYDPVAPGARSHSLALDPVESGEAVSWTSEFRTYEHEPEAGGFGWCCALRADGRDGGWI